MCYLILNPSVEKNSCGIIKPIAKGIYPKVNLIVPVEFELAYYDLVVKRFNHYAAGIPRQLLFKEFNQYKKPNQTKDKNPLVPPKKTTKPKKNK